MNITMETKELKEIFKTVKNFVAKGNGVRPELEMVRFDIKDNVCTATALNGYKAIEIRAACISDGETEFLVPIVDVPKSQFVEITEDEKEVTFSFDTIIKQTVRKGISNGSKHDFERYMLKKEPIFKIGLDPKMLKEVCSGMDNPSGAIELDFYSSNEPVIIKGGNKRALCMPMRLKEV